jgi:aminoglycoside 6'-N-acetyltransferase
VAAPPELSGPRVRLVPCVPEHHARLRDLHLEPEVRRWWQDPAEDWPESDGDAVHYTVTLEGEIVGFVEWDERTTRCFSMPAGLFSDPAVDGR